MFQILLLLVQISHVVPDTRTHNDLNSEIFQSGTNFKVLNFHQVKRENKEKFRIKKNGPFNTKDV